MSFITGLFDTPSSQTILGIIIIAVVGFIFLRAQLLKLFVLLLLAAAIYYFFWYR